MKGTILYGPRDIRFEERDEPQIIEPTDALLRLAATCVCGSDLWPYRGIDAPTQPTPMGHEYCGIVEEVGSAVKSVKKGQFVIGSFAFSDNTCPHCRHGYQTSCQHREVMAGAQASRLRVPLADGTLVATPDVPPADLVPSLLSLSDVMGTGWFAADAANVRSSCIAKRARVSSTLGISTGLIESSVTPIPASRHAPTGSPAISPQTASGRAASRAESTVDFIIRSTPGDAGR